MDKEIEKIEQDFGKDQTIFEILKMCKMLYIFFILVKNNIDNLKLSNKFEWRVCYES